MADTDLDEEKKSSQVVEYLQGPRRKRKSYIVLALRSSFDPDLAHAISNFIKKNFNQFALVIPKNGDEFVRLFSRQILLTLVDDQFMDLNQLLTILKTMKEKKKELAVPILFLTEDVSKLISAYHLTLRPYQEMDNYLDYRSMEHAQIFSRIQFALSQKGRRRGRRYKFNIRTKYFNLRKNDYFDGKILEMSTQGGLLLAEEDHIFDQGDQIKLHIPLMGYLPLDVGEYIRISAKVRRVLMGGNKAALSWEYLGDEQYLRLTEFILEYVNHQLGRRISLKSS